MNHYRDADGAMLVYDITNRNTLRGALNWLTEFKMNAPERARVLLVGNKLDIVEVAPKQREVTPAEIEDIVLKNNLLHLEVSAAVDKHVPEAFEMLIQGRLHSNQK